MMSKLTKEEQRTWRTYHAPGCGNHTNVKIDVVHFNIGSSEEHELAKAKLVWDLRKIGHHVITEAERNQRDEKGNKRRVDVVDLTDDVEYELETDPRRAIRFINDKRVHILPVGWSKEDDKWKRLLENAC
jgi:hypothetical protein